MEFWIFDSWPWFLGSYQRLHWYQGCPFGRAVVPANEASTGLEAVPVCATLGGSEVVLTLRILVVVETGLVLGRSVGSEAVLALGILVVVEAGLVLGRSVGSEAVLALGILVVVEAGLVLGRSVGSEAVLILPSSSGWSAEVSCLSPGLESVEVSHLCLSTFTELPRMLSVSSGWSECSTREVSSLKKLVSSG